MQRHAINVSRRIYNSAHCAVFLAGLCVLVRVTTVRAEAPCAELAKVSTEHCPRGLNLESARGLALGTGARASALSTSALAYNPAALAVGRLYHVEGVVDYMPDMKTVALGGSVVDSSTSRLAAGISFRGFLSGTGGVGGVDGRVGLAFPISDAVSLGVSGRYLSARRDGDAVAALPASVKEAKGFTMDASLRINPVPMFMLYGGAYNFINLDSVYAPIMFGGGLAVGLGDIGSMGADVLVDTTSYNSAAVTVGGGLEFFVAQVVPIRAGYSYDVQRSQNTLTLGLGYTDRAVGLDVSLRQDLGGAGDTRIMGAIRFFVH
jgi:opacity protein-like surface antigen